VRPSSVIGGLALVVVIGGCQGAPTPSRTVVDHAVVTTTAPTTTVPPTTTTTAPICATTGPSPVTVPAATALEPMLLTLDDVPVGYAPVGPQTTAPSTAAEFYGAVPPSLPLVSVDFSLGSAATGPTYDITEALTALTTDQAAVDLLRTVRKTARACGLTGTPVTLSGMTPSLVATTSIGGTGDEDVTSAVVFTTKGPYLLELTWRNSLAVYPDGPPPAPPPLPGIDEMADLAEAALAHLPA
jgi:hypothetical protein